MIRVFVYFIALFAGIQGVQALGFSNVWASAPVENAPAVQPSGPDVVHLTLQWEGPGGVILMLNNAEYVAQSGSTNKVEVPMNKALKVCIKKPFETLCAEYFLIVSEDGGLLRISEKSGRADFEFLNKEKQQKIMQESSAKESAVGMQGTLKVRD
jgi:hypothetical protein